MYVARSLASILPRLDPPSTRIVQLIPFLSDLALDAVTGTNESCLYGDPSCGRLRWSTLEGAVAEASFMTGLERNSDMVFVSPAPVWLIIEPACFLPVADYLVCPPPFRLPLTLPCSRTSTGGNGPPT
jgi:hypothetical protein